MRRGRALSAGRCKDVDNRGSLATTPLSPPSFSFASLLVNEPLVRSFIPGEPRSHLG